MFVDTASLSRSDDRYEPLMQNRDLLWVNGPNRQFEAAAAAVLKPPWAVPPSLAGGGPAYDLFYLMEPDSIPWRDKWLADFVSEIDASRPFAVLGSKYHGFNSLNTCSPMPGPQFATSF